MIAQTAMREVMNAVIFPLSICLLYLMARAWWDVIRSEPEKQTKRVLIAGLFFIFLGETFRSGWAWMSLAAANRELEIFPYFRDAYVVLVLGTLAILAGSLLVIWALASPGKRYHVWTVAIVSVVACATITLVL